VGVATVALPALLNRGAEAEGGVGPTFTTNNDPIPIDLGGYLLGEELEKITPLNDLLAGRTVDPMLLAGALTVLLLGGMVVMGLILYLVMGRLGKMTVTTKNDPHFQEAVSNLEQREKAKNRELAKVQPPTDIPPHTRPRYDAIATGLTIVLLVVFAAIAVAQTFFAGETREFLGALVPAWVPFTCVVSLIAAVFVALIMRPERFANVAQRDNQPVNWSTIWVAISGLIFLGVGTGLMLAIRAAGG
jgi:hypothetical protein